MLSYTINKSVTLIEILVVIVIVGVLAALSLNQYPAFTERNIGKEARTNLEVIYHAQKRYNLDNQGLYFTCAPSCAKTIINSNLGIEVQYSNFSYSITPRDADKKTGFIATATRNPAGICANKKMTLTDLDGPPEKECAQW